MKAFRYASPRVEDEAVDLLEDRWGASELLAGGTDLVGLMKKMVVTPELVVSVNRIDSMRGITADSTGVTIGAGTHLDELLDSPLMDDYPAVKQAIRNIDSLQLQSQSTVGGELCQRPRCWYFRNGYGLLADQGRHVVEGENQYHAIFGNSGPAKFVSASRLAPVLMALGAEIRVVGPSPGDETTMPLEFFYRIPRNERQRETSLEPRQMITHIRLPADAERSCAVYEVRRGAGPADPLAAAAAHCRLRDGVVEAARIYLGQVAPTPWNVEEAARWLVGRTLDERTAREAGEIAVARATPLSKNAYKVQLARVSVERALRLVAGLDCGGF